MDDLENALESLASEFPARVGYAVADLSTGARIVRRADDPFPTASAIKLPVLTAFHAFVGDGGASWSDTVTITESDIPPGSGILRYLDLPRVLSYRDAAWLMTCLSDNAATNVLLRAMTLTTTNRYLADFAGEGLRVRKLAGPPPGPVALSMGEATPAAFGRYLDALAALRLPGADATLETAEHQTHRDAIPRWLPADESEAPDGLRIANKPGSIAGVRTDVGVLRQGGRAVTLAILIADPDATTGGSEPGPRSSHPTDGDTRPFHTAADRLIGRLSRAVYDAWLGGPVTPI